MDAKTDGLLLVFNNGLMFQWFHITYSGPQLTWKYNVVFTLPYTMPSTKYKIFMGDSENQYTDNGSALNMYVQNESSIKMDLYNSILNSDMLLIGF